MPNAAAPIAPEPIAPELIAPAPVAFAPLASAPFALELPASPEASFRPTIKDRCAKIGALIKDRSVRIGTALINDRYARIGAGIFAAGVLVGAIAAAVVMSDDSDSVVENAAPSAQLAAAKPAPLAVAAPATPPAPPKLQATELPVERRPPAEAEKKANAPAQAAARETGSHHVSKSSAASCEKLLGNKSPKRRDPKAAQRETRLANRELVLGNVAEAQMAYCKAFALDRTNIDRHVNLGRFYLFLRDWEQAAKFGQSALALDPKHRRALGVVGDAWAALDKPDEARSAWLAAERKTNASRTELNLMVRRNFALGKKVERLKDFSLAERLYRRVLLLDPKHAGAMKGVASCLERAGDYQGAEEWARRADMVEPAR